MESNSTGDKSAVRQCVVIPVYNHGKTVGAIVRMFADMGVPVIVVDDGSDEETKRLLAETAREFPNAKLVMRGKNGGKGAAVMTGIESAHANGYTHALQIDADGQHDADRAAFFLEESARRPDAAICGLPQFDESAPPSRVAGRKIANIWAHILTLSDALPDVMCGFRVYPVAPTWEIIRKKCLDKRMGFDLEILIRLCWEGVEFIFHPVAVKYPENGISHYHLFRDNARIVWMFIRLFFGMLPRLPSLLRRRKG